ncbi:hypothetical protein V8C37DRAFT_125024 [Trichoderma ceciliae]
MHHHNPLLLPLYCVVLCCIVRLFFLHSLPVSIKGPCPASLFTILSPALLLIIVTFLTAH